MRSVTGPAYAYHSVASTRASRSILLHVTVTTCEYLQAHTLGIGSILEQVGAPLACNGVASQKTGAASAGYSSWRWAVEASLRYPKTRHGGRARETRVLIAGALAGAG